MSDTTYRTNVFGRETEVEYSPSTVAYAMVIVRVLMGWIFLQAGLQKLFQGDWTAAGYLNNAIPEGNPFMGVWANMAGSPTVDALNIWGQILIGVALILGVAVRWSAFWGALMMILYWMASVQGGLLQGLPLEHGWVVDDHIVYVFILFALGAFGAGRVLGLDAMLEKTDFVQNNSWLKYLLG